MDPANGVMQRLLGDELGNFRMIDILRRHSDCMVKFAPAHAPSVVALSTNGKDWFISAYGHLAAKDVVGQLPAAELRCYTHHGWFYDLLQHRYLLARSNTCMELVLDSVRFYPRRHAEVVALTQEHVSALKQSSLFGAYCERILGAPAAFGVICGGEVVAKADVQQRTPKYYEINEVVVHPEQRRKGLAAGVVTAAITWILERGGMPLYTAFSQNSPAVLLAESLGFECFATQLCCEAVPLLGRIGA